MSQQKWVNVKNGLPEPFEVVWLYWRNREVILGCRTYTGDEEIRCPADEGWYSFEDQKGGWCDFWMRLEDSVDEPDPPKELLEKE